MIQIYAYKRNFEVQKAERYFKERRIQVQFVDMGKKGPSKKEVQLFLQRLGNPGAFDTESKLYQGHIVRFTSRTEAIIEAGACCATLGKTILRTETAGMTTTAILLYELD